MNIVMSFERRLLFIFAVSLQNFRRDPFAAIFASRPLREAQRIFAQECM
jgi:hypothetical protein